MKHSSWVLHNFTAKVGFVIVIGTMQNGRIVTGWFGMDLCSDIQLHHVSSERSKREVGQTAKPNHLLLLS